MKLKTGDKVIRENTFIESFDDRETFDPGTECGVIISVWENEYDEQECYIAFFGAEFPVGEPEDKPYVLRYHSMCLRKV